MKKFISTCLSHSRFCYKRTPQTQWLINSINFISHCSESWASLTSTCQWILYQVRPTFWFKDSLSSHCVLTWQKEPEGSWGHFYDSTNSILGTSPSWPNHPAKGPPPVLKLLFLRPHLENHWFHLNKSTSLDRKQHREGWRVQLDNIQYRNNGSRFEDNRLVCCQENNCLWW